MVLLADDSANLHMALHIAPARLDDVAVPVTVIPVASASVVFTTRNGG